MAKAKKDPKAITNMVSLTGVVSECEVTHGIGKNSGIPFLSVKGSIQFGEEDYECVNFKLMSSESNAETGMENKNYPKMVEMFDKIVDKELTVADGAEDPMRISVLGSFADNYFWDQSGEFVENTMIFSAFAKPATSKDEDGASFAVDAYIKSVKEEVVDGEETGRLIVSGYTWDYKGNIIPLNNFYVEDTEDDPSLVDGFSGLYEEGEFGELGGTWKCTQAKSTKKAAFGKAKDRTFTRTEKHITVGSETYSEDSPKYEKVEGNNIKKALNERQMRIDSDDRNPDNQESTTSRGSTHKSEAAKSSAKERKRNVASDF